MQTIRELLTADNPLSPAASERIVGIIMEEERRREEHRATLERGAPVMNCPIDGTVAILADKLGASHDAGWTAEWTAECPLCGLKIVVGRFACVTTLAYFKRKAHYAATTDQH